MTRRCNAGTLILAAAAVVAAAVAGGCATSLEPKLLSLPATGVRPVTRIDRIFDDRVALATIASIVHGDLGFPEFPVTYEFYPHQHALERALLDGGYDAALARTTSRRMVGVGGHRRVLINGRRLADMPVAERVMLLAHELGHSLQYELGGGRRGASDQWLREGFADWLAIQVLERLHVTTLDAVRTQRRREVVASGPGRVLPLSDLVTFPQWVYAGERGGPLLYAYAFLAADHLIDRHGAERVLGYFGRFATSEDRAANFHASFGESLESFEETLHSRLWRR